jgi:dihydroorotate dehydrogenase
MTTYDALFDRVLTRVDPERAHRLGFRAIRAAAPLTRRLSTRTGGAPASARDAQEYAPTRRPPVTAMGLEFPNRLGVAAGFDKNAVGIDGLAALGFGFVEIGTVTALPQPGNPRPRLFRLPQDHAIVNRMGFNNDGAEAVAARLVRRAARLDRRDRRLTGRIGQRPRQRPVLGVNIGKTKVVPEDDEQAVLADYAFSARVLAPHADYLVVNVSSPNTPGLRSLQAVDRLAPLLDGVRRVAEEAAGRHVPLCVKIAPDLADDDVVAVAELARSHGLEGIIATNTTISREGLRTDPAEVEALGSGGLSGPVLRKRSVEVLRILRAHDSRIAIISVGGITTADDARARLRAGADLVQAYTGFVYGGPMWPRRIVAGLGG